jgi:hypothetical protein
MSDKTNSWNPSPFAQITDSELETKDKMQQEHPPATSDKGHQHQKRVVSHHWQRRRLEPTRNQPYPAPTKNHPKASLNDNTLINGKSTSDNESGTSNDSSSSDKESEKSDEESEKSEHSPPNTEQEIQAATGTISFIEIMNGILSDTRSV